MNKWDELVGASKPRPQQEKVKYDPVNNRQPSTLETTPCEHTSMETTGVDEQSLRQRYRLWKNDGLQLASQLGNGVGYITIFNGIQHYLWQLSGMDVKVYMVIASHADNDDGSTWISIARIAEILHCDTSTVDRSISNLEGRGKFKDGSKYPALIKRIRRGMGKSSITVLLPYRLDWTGRSS